MRHGGEEAVPDRPASWSFELSPFRLAFGGFIVLSLIARLYRLDERPIHQDESAIATLAWNLFQGRGYQYNPQHHGPFLYYLDAALFFLFGASDFATRLGQALCGAGLVGCVHAFRAYISRPGLLAAAFFLGFSPTFLYYTRFGKPDPFLILFALLIICFFLRYNSRGEKLDLYWGSACSALLFCTKENSYLYIGVFLSFIGLVVLRRVALSETTLRREWVGATSHIRDHWGSLAISLVIFWSIFVLLYSSFFTNPGGVADGVYRKSFRFWFEQQYQPKGWEAPFSFYLPLLAMYELPVALLLFGGLYTQLAKGWVSRAAFLGATGLTAILSLILDQEFPRGLLPVVYIDTVGQGVIAAFALAIGAWSTLDYLKQGKGFRAFIVYWVTLSFVGYSSIRVKAPWFFIHVLLPQLLLAAIYFGDFWESRFRLRNRRLAAAITGLLILLVIHHTVLLNYHYASDPKERMVTAQTSPDFIRLQNMIGDLSFRTGTGLDMPMAVEDPAAWPMSWYLREYRNWYKFGQIQASDKDKSIIIGDWQEVVRMRGVLGSGYVETWFPHRGWCIPDAKDLTLHKVWRNMIYHDPINSVVYSYLVVFIKKELATNLLQAGRIQR